MLAWSRELEEAVMGSESPSVWVVERRSPVAFRAEDREWHPLRAYLTRSRAERTADMMNPSTWEGRVVRYVRAPEEE